MKKIIFILFLLIATSGHLEAGTTIIDYKDPEFDEPYQTILLNVNSDLQTKKEVEQKAIRELSRKSHTKFLSYFDLFSPFENYSSEQFIEVLKTNNVEAILFTEVVNSQSYNQSISIPIYETSYGYIGGESYSFSTPSTTEINYTVSEWVTNLQLYDVDNSKVVWKAQAFTSGTSTKGMTSNLIKKTINAALDSGLIKKK